MPLLNMTLPEAPARSLPPYLATSAPVEFGSGFYDEEVDGLGRFRWMGLSGRLVFAPDAAARYLELWVLSEFHDLSQELVSSAGGHAERFSLIAGWSPLAVTVPPGADHLDLTINKLFPREYYPGDGRSLAVRLRPAFVHRDPVRHGHIRRQYENGVRNVREMLEGRPKLGATPVSLGIDLYGVCNVKPPCVYCEWDYNKDLEGRFVDAPFTVDTLREWGPLFDNSVSLVNCSIGEPFMMKNFDGLLDAFGDSGKVLEMTTNGQILTDRNIQKLLGRHIDLYISLDAGTPETYAKLRNNRFDTILHNLRRLIQAKGGPGQPPRVHLVFMPMRVNVHELEPFVKICADLRVDRLVLRPLNYSPGVALSWERAGYRFEYQNELLPFDELVRVSGRAAALCQRHGVTLADQMDFGGSMGEQFERWFDEGRRSVEAPPAPGGEPPAAEPPEAPAPIESEPAPPAAVTPAPLPSLGSERKPVCTEPWKSLYILRRGVFPCCYGGAPVAPMDRYREAWNSPLVQAIRTELAQGRFHDYCLRSPACPIVRKAQQAEELPAAQAATLRVREIKTEVDRLTGGSAGRVYRAGKRVFRAITGRFRS
jgi:pyruvate-formate lyase-activating enzyme